MAFDPNLPNDVKQGLKNHPSYFQQALESPYIMGGGNGSATNVAQQTIAKANATAAAAAPPAAPAHPVAMNPSADFVRNDQTAQAAEMGMHRLPAGVSRFNDPMVPGLYAARMADGSLGFSSDPSFAGAGQVDARGVTRQSLRNRTVASNAGAAPRAVWSNGFDPATGQPLAQPMQASTPAQDARLYAQMTGQGYRVGNTTIGADPRAGLSYAENSLHSNPSDQIALAGINPDRAQAEVEKLSEAIANDPNAGTPEVAAANRAALAQLQGHVHDARRQFYGGGESMLGMVGTGGGGRGGLGLRDILTNRYRQGRLAQQAQHDQTMEDIAAKNAETSATHQEQDSADKLWSQYVAAADNPDMQSALIRQNLPGSKAGAMQWLQSPKGQRVADMLLDKLRQGARRVPIAHGGNLFTSYVPDVRLDNIAISPETGGFAGFNGTDGSAPEYRPGPALFNTPTYDQSVLNSVPSWLWQALRGYYGARSAPAVSGLHKDR